MFIDHPHSISRPPLAWLRRPFSADEFYAAVLLAQVAGIVLLASLTGYAYFLAVYGDASKSPGFAAIGVLVAAFYALPQAYSSYYQLNVPAHKDQNLRRVLVCWNFAFLCILFIAFLTKSSHELSRGWILVFYVVGSVAIVISEVAILSVRKAAISSGHLITRRVFLIGTPTKVAEFLRRSQAEKQGMVVVGAVDIADLFDSRHPDQFEPLHSTMAAARRFNVSDIIVLTDWENAHVSAQIAEQFLDMPAAVHLHGLEIVDKFSQIRVDQVGGAKSLVVRPQPLSMMQCAAKRAFDIGVSSLALLVLAPVLAAVALAIKLDSPGPAFFLQRRRGFNHKEFRIFKFRTMTTRDDGANIVQATVDDPRITRIGRTLRKHNIDELPQLLNVLLGHMSLVGPRPHAVAHDNYYEQIINHYGRRLNMKPGITGWAQVNGLRGETKTKAAMEARIEYDLQYIDNWSIAFDMYVMIMTIVSKSAYRNAV